jgi:hypothetical protein
LLAMRPTVLETPCVLECRQAFPVPLSAAAHGGPVSA